MEKLVKNVIALALASAITVLPNPSEVFMEPDRSSTNIIRESVRVATLTDATTASLKLKIRKNSSGTAALAVTLIVFLIPGVYTMSVPGTHTRLCAPQLPAVLPLKKLEDRK